MFAGYSRLLDRFPILTKCVTAGLLFSLGDITSQMGIQYINISHRKEIQHGLETQYAADCYRCVIHRTMLARVVLQNAATHWLNCLQGLEQNRAGLWFDGSRSISVRTHPTFWVLHVSLRIAGRYPMCNIQTLRKGSKLRRQKSKRPYSPTGRSGRPPRS